MEIGPLLHQYRTARGISQSELGRRAECQHSTVSTIERGLRHPSLVMVEALIEGLRASDEEANALRKAAGYPVAGMYVTLPVLTRIDALLTDPNLPESVARATRQQLDSIVTTVSAVMEKGHAAA